MNPQRLREWRVMQRERIRNPQHLVFLTAFQDAPFDAAVDRKREAEQLKAAILLALQAAGIVAGVGVGFGTVEVCARIATPDADATFAALAPVFCASPVCRNGFVLVRYGGPGAPEHQVSVTQLSESLASTV